MTSIHVVPDRQQYIGLRQAHMLYRIDNSIIIGTPSSSRKRGYDTSCKYTAIVYGILYTTTSRPNTNTSTITSHAEFLYTWTACDIPGTKHCKGDTK